MIPKAKSLWSYPETVPFSLLITIILYIFKFTFLEPMVSLGCYNFIEVKFLINLFYYM